MVLQWQGSLSSTSSTAQLLEQQRRQQVADSPLTISSPNDQTPQASSSREYSPEELRRIGRGLQIKEKVLGSLQSKISYIEKVQATEDPGFQSGRLQVLRQEYDIELAEYQSLRSQLGESYGAAKQAAPKQYYTGGTAPAPNNATVLYSQPGSFTGGGIITSTGTKAGSTIGYFSNKGVFFGSTPPGVYQLPGSITGERQGTPRGSLAIIQPGVGSAKGGLGAVRGQYGNTPTDWLPRISTPLTITTVTEQKVNNLDSFYQFDGLDRRGTDIAKGNGSTSWFDSLSVPGIQMGQVPEDVTIPYGQTVIESARERIQVGSEGLNDRFSSFFGVPNFGYKELFFQGLGGVETAISPTTPVRERLGGIKTFGSSLGYIGLNIGVGVLQFVPQTTVFALGGAQALGGELLVRGENLYRGQSSVNVYRTSQFYQQLPIAIGGIARGTTEGALTSPRGTGLFFGGLASSTALPGQKFVQTQEFAGVKTNVVGRYLPDELQLQGGAPGGRATQQYTILAKQGKEFPLRGNELLYEQLRSAEPEYLNINARSIATIAQVGGTGYGKIVSTGKPLTGGGMEFDVITIPNLFKQPGKQEFNLVNRNNIPESRAQPTYGFPFTEIPRMTAANKLPRFVPVAQNANVPLKIVTPEAYLKTQDVLAQQASSVNQQYVRNEAIGTVGISAGLFFEKFSPRVLSESNSGRLPPQEITIGESTITLGSPRITKQVKVSDLQTVYGQPIDIPGILPKTKTSVKPIQLEVFSPKAQYLTTPQFSSFGPIYRVNPEGQAFTSGGIQLRSLLRIEEELQPSVIRKMKRQQALALEKPTDVFTVRSAASRLEFDFGRNVVFPYNLLFSQEGAGTIVTGIFRPKDTKLLPISAKGKVPQRFDNKAELFFNEKGELVIAKIPGSKGKVSTFQQERPGGKLVPVIDQRNAQGYGAGFTVIDKLYTPGFGILPRQLWPKRGAGTKSFFVNIESQIGRQARKKAASRAKTAKEAANAPQRTTSGSAMSMFMPKQSQSNAKPTTEIPGMEYSSVKPGERITLSTKVIQRSRARFYPDLTSGTQMITRPANRTQSKPESTTSSIMRSITQNVPISTNILTQRNIQKNVQKNIQRNLQSSTFSLAQVSTQKLTQTQTQTQRQTNILTTESIFPYGGTTTIFYGRSYRERKKKKAKGKKDAVVEYGYQPSLLGLGYIQKSIGAAQYTGLASRGLPNTRAGRSYLRGAKRFLGGF